MFALIKRVISYRFFPFSWTALIIILLCLPGSMVPGRGLFESEHLDKVAHVILFGCNVLFWSWHFMESGTSASELKRTFIVITLLTILLGVVLEFIQMYFIANRSFDSGDIIADVIGSALGMLWLMKN